MTGEKTNDDPYRLTWGNGVSVERDATDPTRYTLRFYNSTDTSGVRITGLTKTALTGIKKTINDTLRKTKQ